MSSPRAMSRLPRKKGAWAGNFINALTPPTGTIGTHVIWDTADWDNQNMTGVATHRVTHLSLVCTQGPAATAHGVLGWYLMLFPVDSAFTPVPATALWDPLSIGTLENFERRVLASGILDIPPGPQAGLMWNPKFEARRRVTSQDWLVFVYRPSISGTVLSIHARTNIAA